MLKEIKARCPKTSQPTQSDSFNLYLQLPTCELMWEIGVAVHLSPDEIGFLINPRRLRGSDFLMRWAQGRWSEEKIPYIVCKEFGTVSGQSLLPRTFVDKNGKMMTYVTFSGGDIQLSPDVFEVWGHRT